MEPMFLVNCRDDFEAQLIEGILKGANIPVERRYQGGGDMLRVYGGKGLNVDLYVPGEMLEVARALLEATIIEEEEDF